ncbi:MULTISPECIES: siroheme synthase CysG [Actibacterium]|uniref:Uroporphyrin-III C-methyltransferase/precorrin-2 dehydrogenase/sirohydrochlorin ferrochelatase n=1 Tax=Actibacterium naphthalenivorans TaxID=1614693 RepID=A0A840CBT7_9RHOB|nr:MULTISPECIES: siroheme synthase CysG [Actibacterium]ALG89540.1 siroheme synthase [Actibacterium sp. EMB200-NS6]MBB4020809.1 uroporphyrin-III C-methyltransferase/precorrin-2 dehydrogenase/sirohydrochlorin ferrochelatase [Actibacterium naphthalenivorans]
MKTFPMFLKMAGRDVVIVGGGEQAAQKARLMLKTEARLILLAPVLDEELQALVDTGRAVHDTGAIGPARFADAALVFIATGCPGLDAAVHALAKAAGAVVNVVDQPALCDALTPSIVDRDPVVVAIGTEGAAPVLARQIKTRIETMLEPRLGEFASLAGRMRAAVAQRVPREGRRAFWRWAFSETPRRMHAAGAERDAARALKDAIAGGGAPDADAPGVISLVGAGPGSADLLTMRAVQRLQEADIIFYDRLVDPAVLELARRDAERVYVGKAVGACAWPQERIDAIIVAAAKQGKRVVRLKSGDPCVFGRASEELAAARAAGLTVEIVPGVTAATAAAASIGQSLTERGQTDRLVFATGTCRDGDEAPDWGRILTPGTALALYMGVRKAAEIQHSLLESGLPPESIVEIISAASTVNERHVSARIDALAETIEIEKVPSPSILLVRRPKHFADAQCADDVPLRLSA